RPAAVCRARGGDGAVHVVSARLGDLGQDLLGGRADSLERGTSAGGDELAVDEQPVGALDVYHGAGLRRRCVLEGRHLGSSSVLVQAGGVVGDVVGSGVGAGLQLLPLEQQVVEQAGGAEPEVLRVQPGAV